jgi:hypothetical protein
MPIDYVFDVGGHATILTKRRGGAERVEGISRKLLIMCAAHTRKMKTCSAAKFS